MSSTESDGCTAPAAEFDEFADDYEAALDRGLALTGEGKEYFANGRLKWTAKCLSKLNHSTASCLDFGCGIGTATPFLFEHLAAGSVLGIDPSDESLEVARADHPISGTRFENSSAFAPSGDIDTAYCNGVFHHIPPPDRPEAVRQVFDTLRPGGYFALWENNAWNPVTRFLMSRVPFDRDAVLLWPKGARRMLRQGGFEITRTDFAFVFPSALKFLRFLEAPLRKLPLGGQYLVLARKPS